MYRNSEILIEDTSDHIKVKEIEYNTLRNAHGAMSNAMSIIKGSPDKLAMFEQAMDVVATDFANKVGEMEQFMDSTKQIMATIDLQNGVFEEQGLKQLEEYEKKSTLLLLGGNSDVLELKKTPIAEPIARGGSNEYDNLFT